MEMIRGKRLRGRMRFDVTMIICGETYLRTQPTQATSFHTVVKFYRCITVRLIYVK